MIGGSITERGSARWFAAYRGISLLEHVPLGRTARTVLFLVVAVTAGSALADLRSVSDLGEPTSARPFIIAALFALFAWRPPIAAAGFCLLSVGGVLLSALGLLDESAGPILTATFVAAILVALTCSLLGTLIYVATVIACGVAREIVEVGTTTGMTLTLVASVLLTTIIGASLRIVMAAQRAAADELEDAKRAHEALLRDERERIADDLHDIVAHELTVIAMQARALGLSVDERTPRTFAEAIDAITDSSTRALDDVRRVISATAEADATTDTVAHALDAAVATLRELGFTVHTRDDLGDGAPHGLVEATIARMIREAATNIAKYGHPDAPASFAVAHARDHVVLDVVNGIRPHTPDRDPVASTSRGIARHRERARQLGGELTTSADGDTWTLHVALPIESSTAEHPVSASLS